MYLLAAAMLAVGQVLVGCHLVVANAARLALFKSHLSY